MKKEKKSKFVIFMTIFISLSMIVSIFAIVIDNYNTTDISYNGHTFKITNTGYKTKINGTYVEFQYFPSDLERINISDDIVNKLHNAEGIVFVFDPNISIDNLAFIDYIRFEMPSQYGKPVYYAITNSSSNYALPQADCANATANLPFIKINLSSESGFLVSEENSNCIYMNAKLKEIVALKDRLVYRLSGIMVN